MVLFGWKFGIFVFIVDVLKASIPVLIILSIYNNNFFFASLAGAGAILGHIYPFFMNFNGGKGFSCYLGLLMGLDFMFGLLASLATGILVMVTNYVAVGTILILIFIPIFLYFSCDTLTFNFLVIMILLSSIIIIKHIENLYKISKGTESTFWSVFNKK